MKTVQTTFTLTYSNEQYQKAKAYVDDMKKHPKRIYWLGKKGKNDEDLIFSHIAHKILSGFYNNYDLIIARKQILDMKNYKR